MKAEVLRIFNDDKVGFFLWANFIIFIWPFFLTFSLDYCHEKRPYLTQGNTTIDDVTFVRLLWIYARRSFSLLTNHRPVELRSRSTLCSHLQKDSMYSKQIINYGSKWQKCYFSEGIKNVISVRKCLNMKGIDCYIHLWSFRKCQICKVVKMSWLWRYW